MTINPITIGDAKKFIVRNGAAATCFGTGYYHTWHTVEADGFVMVFRRGRFADQDRSYPVCWVEKADAAYLQGQMQGFFDRDVF